MIGVHTHIRAAVRRCLTWWRLRRAGSCVRAGAGLHIGAGTRLWAPDSIHIGRQVYIGRDVHIEANCEIGNHCLLANRVAIVGRHDHDFREIGVPVRFGTWIGTRANNDERRIQKAVVEDDVWLGFGSVLLTGVRVGRGAIVAAGSVVTRDVAPYAIVAGSPARVIGERFADAGERRLHERAIAGGRFEFSEKGPSHWIVSPDKDGSHVH